MLPLETLIFLRCSYVFNKKLIRTKEASFGGRCRSIQHGAAWGRNLLEPRGRPLGDAPDQYSIGLLGVEIY